MSKALGLDRAKMIFTAAAPISKQTLQYFQSINIPLFEIYGMSETGGALTMGTPSHSRITSIGTIMPCNEYKIGNPDEDGSGEVIFLAICIVFKLFTPKHFLSLFIIIEQNVFLTPRGEKKGSWKSLLLHDFLTFKVISFGNCLWNSCNLY